MAETGGFHLSFDPDAHGHGSPDQRSRPVNKLPGCRADPRPCPYPADQGSTPVNKLPRCRADPRPCPCPYPADQGSTPVTNCRRPGPRFINRLSSLLPFSTLLRQGLMCLGAGDVSSDSATDAGGVLSLIHQSDSFHSTRPTPLPPPTTTSLIS